MNGTLIFLLILGAIVALVVVTGGKKKGQAWKALNAPVVQTGLLGVLLGILVHRLGGSRRDELGDAYSRLIDAQDEADKVGARDYLSGQARDPRHNPRLARYQPQAQADPPPNE